MATKLPEDFKKRWIGALRTGDFKQGQGALYDKVSNTYCCLGVAAICEGVPLDKIMHLGYAHGISEEFRTDGLRALHPLEDNFVTLNDSRGKTFSQIADIIEQDY